MKTVILILYQIRALFIAVCVPARIRIGFVVDTLRPYDRIMASTRLRVYDVILMFRHATRYLLLYYLPWFRFDVVLFQKILTARGLQKMKRVQQRGSAIIYDLNVNYLDLSDTPTGPVTKEQQLVARSCIEYADAIITPSPYIADRVHQESPTSFVRVIEEAIPEQFFSVVKNPMQRCRSFVWAGYSVKAHELLMITHALRAIAETEPVTLTLISERDPHLFLPIETTFVTYNHRTIHADLLRGDAFLAPRDLTHAYNNGHSFTKIGIAMAVGLLVVASPVPAYEDSPALLCRTPQEWSDTLSALVNGTLDYAACSRRGVEYCTENYRTPVIRKKYEQLFSELCDR